MDGSDFFRLLAVFFFSFFSLFFFMFSYIHVKDRPTLSFDFNHMNSK